MEDFERPVLMPLILDIFGPLVGVTGRIAPYHLRSLEISVLHLLRSPATRQQWVQSVRAALSLLQKAADWHPQALGLHVYSAMDAIGPVQMEVGMLGKRFWDCDRAARPDDRFRPILDLYACLYERLYPRLAAPIVAANALLNATDVSDVISEDGRVRPRAVERIEGQQDFRPGLLTGGLDIHLRNSISHGRYQILSSNEIRMEDRDPRRNTLTWGPHVFSHDRLFDKTSELDLTCRALLAALIMFDVNNHDVFQARGYLPKRGSAIRADLAEVLMRGSAESLGFTLDSWQGEGPDSTVQISLKVSGYREYGPSEIVTGSQDRAVARYRMDVRTEEVSVARQVYYLLQLTLDCHESYEAVVVEVTHHDGTPAGRLRTNRATRQRIFEGDVSFQEVRQMADEDTLSDVSMPVVLRGLPHRL
jgi:hypothetical protein